MASPSILNVIRQLPDTDMLHVPANPVHEVAAQFAVVIVLNQAFQPLMRVLRNFIFYGTVTPYTSQ